MTRTSIRALAELLRDRSRWPEGFEWNYAIDENCAIGLSAQHHFGGHRSARHLPLVYFDAPNQLTISSIFFGRSSATGLTSKEITPEVVAEAIEDYLKQKHQQELL